MKIIPFGSNGFFPSFGRQTACYIIPYGKTLIILDAGSGLFRLAEPEGQRMLKGASEIHLFLSHYHLDHTFGFYAAFELFKNKTVKIFASSNREVFSEFPSLSYFPINYSLRYKNFSWQSLKEGTQKISSYKVSVKKQNHREEVSLALRFDWGLAYSTDGQPTRGSIEFIKGSQILLHEHWFCGEELYRKKTKIENHVIDGHVTTVGAALIAKEAKVRQLVLVHHYPFANKKQLEKQLVSAKSIFTNSILAEDKKTILF